tara:strand:+ start:144 stop:464 length:321 start_codon:yes stop_codon:yes gene_type:complete
MNLFTGSGRLVKNATVNGNENTALKFAIAAKYGYDKDEKKDRVEFIPCVLFNPTEKLVFFLTEEGKGTLVEFQGRINISRYEVNGEKKYSTQVVINKSSFNILSRS